MKGNVFEKFTTCQQQLNSMTGCTLNNLVAANKCTPAEKCTAIRNDCPLATRQVAVQTWYGNNC